MLANRGSGWDYLLRRFLDMSLPQPNLSPSWSPNGCPASIFHPSGQASLGVKQTLTSIGGLVTGLVDFLSHYLSLIFSPQ